jgi:hypothetical protein
VQSFITGKQKIMLSLEISEFDHQIGKKKIRRDRPNWCELEVKHEILRQAFRSEPVPEGLEKQMQQRVQEFRASQSAGLE